MYSITEIEDAIIVELRKSQLGAWCKKIDTFVPPEGEDIEKAIREFVKDSPSVLVVYAGGEYKNREGVQDRYMTFKILVVAQSLRDRSDIRRGSVGSYALLDEVRKALTTKTLDLQIQALLPERETAEVNSQLMSAYSIEFRTMCRYTYGT